jgi:hypothetical protein
MILDGTKLCNGCRTDESQGSLVDAQFRVRATGHELPLLHLCATCLPQYEAKAGLEKLEEPLPS